MGNGRHEIKLRFVSNDDDVKWFRQKLHPRLILNPRAMASSLIALSAVALSPSLTPNKTPWWIRAVPVGDETQLKGAVS